MLMTTQAMMITITATVKIVVVLTAVIVSIQELEIVMTHFMVTATVMYYYWSCKNTR